MHCELIFWDDLRIKRRLMQERHLVILRLISLRLWVTHHIKHLSSVWHSPSQHLTISPQWRLYVLTMIFARIYHQLFLSLSGADPERVALGGGRAPGQVDILRTHPSLVIGISTMLVHHLPTGH